MGNTTLYDNERAETEANEVAYRFVNSRDVIGDMGRAYGTSFSSIHMHDDAASHSKVRAAGKDAIASGRDIYFGEGILNDHSEKGNMIVGHELAHTMQQSGGFGMSETVSMGAEQGGLWSTIKGWFKKKTPAATPTAAPTVPGAKVGERGGVDPWKGGFEDYKIKSSKVDQSQKALDYMDRARWEWRDTDTKALHNRIVPKANSALKKGKDGIYDVSQNLATLGIRTSSTEEGKEEGYLRRHIMMNNNPNMINELTDHAFEAANSPGHVSESLSTAGAWDINNEGRDTKISAGTEMVTQHYLHGADEQLSSDDGLEYLSSIYDMIEGADVFHKAGADPMTYMMQTFYTGFAGNLGSNALMKDNKSETKLSDQQKDFMMHTRKNMMVGPKMYMMTQEQRDALPESAKSHYAEYLTRRAKLVEKLNEVRRKKGKSAVFEQAPGANNIARD